MHVRLDRKSIDFFDHFKIDGFVGKVDGLQEFIYQDANFFIDDELFEAHGDE